jgi:hypothetical protein
LIAWQLLEPRLFFGNQAKGHAPADTYVVESVSAREGRKGGDFLGFEVSCELYQGKTSNRQTKIKGGKKHV